MTVEIPLDRERVPKKPFRIADSVRVAAETFARPYPELVMDVATTMFGKGKVKPEEYFRMRMFDAERAEAPRFVGRQVAYKHNLAANDLLGWRETLEDKLVFHALMTGVGLPVPELVAMVHPDRGLGGTVRTLSNPSDLVGFLQDSSHFPLFLKPNTLAWSVGTASLVQSDGTTLTDLFGRTASIDDFSKRIADLSADGGFLCQRTLQNHQDLAAVCGPSLATVRIMVVRYETGVKVLRTHIKLPTGKNVADNTWRSGNLAVAVDPETGTLANSGWIGEGMDAIEINEHPDTGSALNITLPNWSDALSRVVEAMNVLHGFRLVGWDVAFTPSGPVIVEGNSDPDWGVTQRLSKRGLLEQEFSAFLENCKKNPRS